MPIPIDTLVCDTASIVAWQQDPAFDYNRELIEPQQTILEWLFNVIMGFLAEAIQDAMRYELSWIFLAIFSVLFLGIVGWLLYKYRPGLFGRSKKEGMDYEIEEDTIYGIDFDTAIREALERKDYREAVRLKYLQTLKMLTESGRIDWQLHKTPTQYTYEYSEEDFLRMTRQFLRIRYGNFDATPEIYEEMANGYLLLANSQKPSPNTLEKGGDV